MLVDENVDVERLVEGVCEALAPLAANKGLGTKFLTLTHQSIFFFQIQLKIFINLF